MRIYKYFIAMMMLLSWTTASHAISIKLDGTGGLTSGTDCHTGALYRFGTENSYNGQQLDLLVEVTGADNDYNNGTTYCTYVKDSTLATNLRDTDAGDNVAYEEYQLTLVKKGTTTPVEVDRLMLTGYDLDINAGGGTDTDDFYVAADGAYITSSSAVTHTSGLFYGSYTDKMKGWSVDNCNDSAATPDITCRASSIWINGNGQNKVSTVKVRVQNDNAYGEYTGDSYAYRLIQLSFQIEDFSNIFNGQKEYGDAPTSYGQAGGNLDGTIMLGYGLPADAESAYQNSSDASADDSDTAGGNYDDDDAVVLSGTGTTLSGQSLNAGDTLSLDIITYGSGYLQLWFDFNRDGDFLDAGEHVIDSQMITNTGESVDGITTNTNASSGVTTTHISFTIPSSAKSGNSFVRVRFSQGNSADEKDPTKDLSLKGEVEDYQVSITNAGSISGNVSNPASQGIADVSISIMTTGTGATIVNDINGNPLTTTTDTNGHYRFTNIPLGTYNITETDKAGYTSVNDIDGGNANEIAITVAASGTYTHQDFIDTLPTGAISGIVTLPDSTPIADAKIELRLSNGAPAVNNDGTPTTRITTDATGTFSFTNIPTGDYMLLEVDASGYISVSDNAGDDNAINNNTNDGFIPVTLTAGENDSDNIYIDKKSSGSVSGKVTDKFDNALENVTITIQNSAGNTVNDIEGNPLTTVTDVTGLYTFVKVPAGEYLIVESDKAGYTSIRDGDETPDSDTNANTDTNDNKIPLTLTDGKDDTQNNFIDEGYKSISGKVLVDTNGDERPEKSLENVTIKLSSCETNTFTSTITDSAGAFHFSNLIAGCYTLTEIDPEGYTSVKDSDGSNDNNITVALTDVDVVDRTFIDEPSVKVSGKVSADTDFDDMTDTVLENVTIKLLDTATGEIIETTQTDNHGDYSFSNLSPSAYTIQEVDPEGYASLSDVEGDNDNLIMITVSESDITGQDFIDQKRLSISGVVKVDIDGDNLVDEPLKNSTLIICQQSDPCDSDHNIASTLTDENGTYTFDNLGKGDYKIIEIDKEGYESLKDSDGANDNTIHVTLIGNGDVTGQDFDNQAVAPKFVILHKSVAKKQAHIGDFVPYSITVENVNDSYNYASLKIKDILPAGFKYEKGSAKLSTGTSKTALTATGTKVVEFGSFALAAKQKATITYLLKVGAAVAKGDHTNTASAIQNSEEVSNISKATVTIIADPFIDNSVVVGKVFEDHNGNGIQDKNERGIPGVRLATVEGMLIETDGYGRYHIADVKSGGYAGRGSNFIVKVDAATLPKGATFTTENPRVYRVTSGQLNVIDFGVKLPKAKHFSKERTLTKITMKKRLVEVEKSVKIGSIFFDSDQFCIRPNQVQSLCNIAKKIKKFKNGSIMIEGNTDARAPMWYNKKLAYKRAASVYKELKHQLGDQLIKQVDVIYDNCEKEVKFNPRYDWWGKPNIPRTKKECTEFGISIKECHRLLNAKKGGAL